MLILLDYEIQAQYRKTLLFYPMKQKLKEQFSCIIKTGNTER